MSTIEQRDFTSEPYVSDSNDPKRHFVMEGDVMTGVDLVWHATGADTAGQVTIVEVLFPAKTEFLMHRHEHEDEAFLVIEGELTLRDGDGDQDDFIAGPGQMVWAPRRHKHTYAATSDVPAKVIVVMTPGSGLEDFFASNAETKLSGEDDLTNFAQETERKYGVELFPTEPTAGSARGY
jgi:quercetin dioxygenase-like cupin family protein